MHTYYNRLIILRVSWQRQANNEDVDEVALWGSVRLAMERSEYYTTRIRKPLMPCAVQSNPKVPKAKKLKMVLSHEACWVYCIRFIP